MPLLNKHARFLVAIFHLFVPSLGKRKQNGKKITESGLTKSREGEHGRDYFYMKYEHDRGGIT